jgi:cytochrome P450
VHKRNIDIESGTDSVHHTKIETANMPSMLELLGFSCSASALLHFYLPRYSFGLFSTAFLLFFSLFALQALWKIVVYPRFLSPLRDLPTPPDNHWFFGQTRKIMREPSGKPMREWTETLPNDGLVKYSMWFQERVLITNPKLLGEVLVTKNYDFIKPRHFRDGLGRILGIGILLAEGDEHKRQRKDLMPAFAYRHVKDLYPVFWGKSRELVECLRVASKESESSPTSEKMQNVFEDSKKVAADVPKHAPGIIDVGEWASRATLDIIGLSGMGRDFDSLQDPSNQLNQHYRSVFEAGRVGRLLQILGVFLPFWLVKRIPVKRNHEMNDASEFIKQTCRDLIKQKRQAMQEKERTQVDILSVALESGNFTDEDLVNQMMTFLVAGHETTATAMIWALYLLCQNPDIQRKLREEVRSKLPSIKNDVTAAEIDNCHYLHAVCSEVLRLWSPVSMTMRIAAHDTTLNGHFIPADTTIILAPWAINTSNHLWGSDAQEFKPDRWLDADGKANNKGGADSNYSFLTFLHGPRSCKSKQSHNAQLTDLRYQLIFPLGIGQKFAQAEFACLLAAWVGTFDTKFEEGSALAIGKPEIKGGITMKPKGGLWAKLEEVPGW